MGEKENVYIYSCVNKMNMMMMIMMIIIILDLFVVLLGFLGHWSSYCVMANEEKKEGKMENFECN